MHYKMYIIHCKIRNIYKNEKASLLFYINFYRLYYSLKMSACITKIRRVLRHFEVIMKSLLNANTNWYVSGNRYLIINSRDSYVISNIEVAGHTTWSWKRNSDSPLNPSPVLSPSYTSSTRVLLTR